MSIKLRYKLILAGIILSGVFLYGRCGGKKVIKLAPVQPVIPVEDKEQILIDPVKHTITVKTPHGVKTSTLPDRVSTVDVHKDGSVTVTAKQFGLEMRPFAGIYYTDTLRFGAGLDGLYFKKLDLGLGMAGASGSSTIGFLQVSYTIFDNLRLGLVYSTKRYIGGSISLRI